MNARKEAVSIVYSQETGTKVPVAAIIRDPASNHHVIYALEEMNGDQIEGLINAASIGEKKV